MNGIHVIVTVGAFALLANTSVALAQQAATARAFDSGDSPNPWSGDDDWAFGYYKAECSEGGPAVGISAQHSGATAHSVLCKSPINGPFQWFTSNRETEIFSSSDSVDYPSHCAPGTSCDWDAGYLKGECSDTEFVIGVAQGPPQQGAFSAGLDHIRCGYFLFNPNGYTPSTTCHTVSLPGNHPASLPDGDWAPGIGVFGQPLYDKLECNPFEVMVGVSVGTFSPHKVHSIRCCTLQAGPG
jgi:hypothetical protein